MFASSLVAVSSLLLGANALTPTNLVPTSISGALSALKYIDVGGEGTYNEVVNMIDGTWPSCTVNPSCITQPKTVSGAYGTANSVVSSLTILFFKATLRPSTMRLDSPSEVPSTSRI